MLLFLLSSIAHILLSPYSKVEESFNLHAIHDLLAYGTNTSNFDHFTFPGAVPRTFVGSVILASIVSPIIHLNIFSSKTHILITVRVVLAFLNAIALSILRKAISSRFGSQTATLFTLFTCSQFHLPFWMGRTIPNMFALFPVTLSFAFLLHPNRRSVHTSLALLTITSIIFRSELVLLLAPLTLQVLFCKWSTFWRVLRVGIISAFLGICVTVLVDSYFWNQWPLWPELYSIYFNVLQGKSSEWGTSPYHTYLSTHLPKLTLTAFPLSLLSLLTSSSTRTILFAPSVYILLISALAHKEWRFIVYVVPVVNLAAARGSVFLLRKSKNTFLRPLFTFFIASCILANLAATSFMTFISRDNYPGGRAMERFNTLFANESTVHVHISNLAAQTGASLFLHEHSPPYFFPSLNNTTTTYTWTYNKTEHLTPRDFTSPRQSVGVGIGTTPFTHLVVESKDVEELVEVREEEEEEEGRVRWEVVEYVKGFDRVSVRWSGTSEVEGVWARIPFVEVVRKDQLCILKRSE